MSEKITISFKPSGKSISVSPGTVLTDAIALAALELNLPCGGQGRCGRCKVVIEEGEVKRRSVSRLSDTELEQGYALACQSLAQTDLTVFIPPQEEMIVRKLPSERHSAEIINLPVPCDWQTDPGVRQLHLKITPPSLADNTTDFERLKRELGRQYEVKELIASLPVVRRLARTLRDAEWDVTAVLETHNWRFDDGPPRLIDLLPGGERSNLYAVAIDIGTTSNVVYLVDLLSGKVLDTAAEYNQQISCGEDIISRIVYAKRPGGLEHLQRLVVQTLNGLIETLAERQGIASNEIYKATVAGNTTMIHLFLGMWPEPIRLEPYIPTVNHPLPVKAVELGLHINPEAVVDCLPGVGSYVGADITAGVLSSLMYQTDKLTLFIDVGTNGEIVLGNFDWLISCACSAGPAFEGAGVHSGMRATVGAIDDVWIHSQTYEPTYRVIGNKRPRGICGSGMISLLAEMFLSGVIDKAGKVNVNLDTPRTRVGEHGPEYVIARKEETHDQSEDIVITQADITNLLRAKAAIYAGFSVLTRSVGLQLAEVEQVLIGGAFGKYIDIEKAIQIGLLPDMPWDRFQYLGNTSVLGAYTALLCPNMRRELMHIAERMTYLELSADNTFYDEFTKALFLPHTELATFPSVARLLEQEGC
ncbi:MAG: ASKHA domain-containing protein [Chloroflexota bacterium]|nr:ASKHA domain-containing protein [Chloroflexota bacterium]